MSKIYYRRYLLPLLLMASVSAGAATEVRLDSEDGEKILSGRSLVLTESNGTFTVTNTDRTIIDILWDDASGTTYNLSFAAPIGEDLQAGEYAEASRSIGNNADAGALYIFSNSETCSASIGDFTIHEIEFDSNDTLTKLAIDATQHCEYWLNRLEAQIRIDSSVLFDLGPSVTVEDDLVVDPGANVSISVVQASSTNGAIVSTNWRQLSGIPVTLSGANSSTVTLIAPSTDAEHEVLEFEVEVTDAAGESAIDRVFVTTGAGTPQYRFRIVDLDPDADPTPIEVDMDPDFFGAVGYDGSQFLNYVKPSDPSWSMTAIAKLGDRLTIGQYNDAYKFRQEPPPRPGLTLEIEGVPGCNRARGRFEVLDIGYADNNAVTRIALNATYQCYPSGNLPFEIRLRANSVIPLDSIAPRANPGPDLVVLHGDDVYLDGSNSTSDIGEIVDYEWQQVSGPVVSLQDTDAAIASFVAPDVPEGTGLAEFSLTVTNESGRRDTETVTVDIRGSEDKRSIVELFVPENTGFEFVTYSTDGTYIRIDENGSGFELSKGPLDTSLLASRQGRWKFQFASDGDSRNPMPDIPVGMYEYAADGQPGQPSMQASGEGRGCNQTGGRFIVHENIEDDGQPVSLAVDFEQICDGNATLYGKIRVNTTVPLDAPGLFATTGPDIDAVPDQLVILDGTSSYVGPTAGVTYLWEQISGPAVTIVDPTQVEASFVAPPTAGDAVFRLTVTNAEGLTSSTTTTISLAAPGTPVTALFISSEPGDRIGAGLDHYFDSEQMGIRAYDPDRLHISNGSFPVRWYRARFEPPEGQTFQIGDYTRVSESRFLDGSPGITGFSGMGIWMNYRNCLSSTGWYRIHELEPLPDGSTIGKLAVDFYQQCDKDLPGLAGSLRVNSTVPAKTISPVVTAGPDVTGRAGTEVQLDAGLSFSWSSTLVTYRWRQISGPAAQIANVNAIAPAIQLPNVNAPSEDLVFEVEVTDATGESASATTTVTVLAQDTPWSEMIISSFDRTTDAVLESLSYNINNSYIDVQETVAGDLYGFVEGRYVDAATEIAKSSERDVFATGATYRRFENARGISAFGNAEFGSCHIDKPGWVHIKDLVVDGDQLKAASYEAEKYCNEEFGIRMSVRLKSSTPINVGEFVLELPPDQSITEGETVTTDDAVAYVEGQHAKNVTWSQISGPDVLLAPTENARTSFIAPATSSDTEIVLRLSVEKLDGVMTSEDVRFDLLDNGIGGFPDDVATMDTVPGTYDATGRPVGFRLDNIVAVEAESPNVEIGGINLDRVPYGVFDMELTSSPGASVEFTIYFSEPVAANAEWLHKLPSNIWRRHQEAWTLAADRRSMSVTVSDNGSYDYDQAANGIILIRGGIAEPATNVTPPTTGGGNGGGGGGGSLSWLMLLTGVLVIRSNVGAARAARRGRVRVSHHSARAILHQSSGA